MSDSGFVIHIGPFKTGSTSIESTLAEHREALLASGILFPILAGGRAWNQTVSCLDLYARHPNEVSAMKWHEVLIKNEPWVYQGAWQQLMDACRDYEGQVTWSSETLSGASSAVVARIVLDMGRPLDRVLWVYRPMSKILPSYYQEDLKSTAVPAFEEYARKVLTHLLGGGHVHPFSWMDAPWVREQWLPHCGEFQIVAHGGVFSDASLRECLSDMTQGRLDELTTERENRGLSAAAGEALRRALADRRPQWITTSFRAVHRIRERDSAHGGKFVLTPQVASLVDQAWSHPVEPGPQQRQQAKDELAQLIESDAPITGVDMPDGFDFEEEVRQLLPVVNHELRVSAWKTSAGNIRRRLRGKKLVYKGHW